jgi:hemoglobin/transferrin/lactoferrin receptor protein
MNKIFCFLLICFLNPQLFAQDTLQQGDLDEILIFSGKFAERKKNLVQKVEVINARRIEQLNAQNTGDLLMQTGNVFVQKSQQGGSSPVIRGFEASRVLLVIDGIRMNNAIYRSGHLQNVITVDQNMLDRIEVLYGPSSTLYGSDALGGVVHMRTKIPKLSTGEKTLATGSVFSRYSSANNEKTFHADLSLGGKKFGWLQSYNYSDFGDLRMGSNDLKNYPGFGTRNEYVIRTGGMDMVIANDNNRIQRPSGYQQWDITQKFLYRPHDKIFHQLNFQVSNSGNIPRYDRLQDRRNNLPRFSEWYYGPQKRILAAYEFNYRTKGLWDEFRTIISYQKINESRHQRLFMNSRRDNRMEDLDVAAITIDARKFWKQHELVFGADAQYNRIRSSAFGENIETGQLTGIDSRYPDGKNNMVLPGIYFQHLLKFGNGKFVLNDGVRLQATYLRSTIADNSFFNFPFTSIHQNNLALTANIGLIYMPGIKWRFTSGISTGFRSPNIDDLAKIFESNAASRQLIVPNADIQPEYTYNGEVGITYQNGKIRMEAGGFYTLLRNAIALAPFRLNNQDSVDYNGMRSAVFASQNANEGYLTGMHAMFRLDLVKNLQFTGSINYTYGRLRPGAKEIIPMDHIPPVYGRASFTYRPGRIENEFYILFNGWKRLEDYHPSGEDNAQYATIHGTPAWMSLNWKTGITLKNWVWQAGIENITDLNYRVFASGLSAPGRNFILALRLKL